MVFKKGVIPLGSGKAVYAREKDGKYEFLIDTGSSLVKKSLVDKVKTGKGTVISYADDAVMVKDGIVERKGNKLTYVPKN